MIPLILLLITFIYLTGMVVERIKPGVYGRYISPGWLATFLAAASAVFLVTHLREFPQWQQPLEVAWTGVTSSGPELSIGGEKRSTVVGWPTGMFWPQVTLARSGKNSAILTVRGGGGFARIADADFLNGAPQHLNEPYLIGNFYVKVTRYWIFWRQLEILDAKGQSLVTVPIGGASSVVPMDQVLAGAFVDLRSHHDAKTAADLEDWAAAICLVGGDHGYRIVTFTDPDISENVALPVSVNVVWPGNRKITVKWTDAGEAGLAAEFQAPWRMSTPLPPTDDTNPHDHSVTLTSHPLPGDRAFVLPFGDQIADRIRLQMDDTVITGCEKAPVSGVESYLEHPQPRTSHWRGVTCEQSVAVGPYGLDFKAVRDVPSSTPIAISLAVALFSFGISLRLCLSRIWPGERWTVAGIALWVWLILLFRAHLSLRYALDPRFLDSLAVSGVVTAMVLLTLGPAAVAFAGTLWMDQFLDDTEKVSAGRKVALNVLLLGAAITLQFFLVVSYWPNVPPAYSPLTGLKARAFFLGGLCAGALVFLAVFIANYLPQPRFNAPERSKPLRLFFWIQRICIGVLTMFHRVATDSGPRFWRAVYAENERPLWWRRLRLPGGLRYRREGSDRFYRKSLYIVLGIFLMLSLAAFLVWVNFLGTTKWIQEIIVPLFVCWLPACLLLASRKAFPPGSKQSINAWRFTFVTCILLFFAILGFRIAVQDVGGVVAAVSVFIPVVVILFVGGRPFTVQLIPIGVLMLAAVIATLFYVNFHATLGILKLVHAETAGSRILAWKEGPDATKLLAFAGMNKKEAAPVAVTRRHLADAIEHSRENLLMAHVGGSLGLPYGEAPTRRSQVRQDTIQFDSAFSFYVLSENGLIGGLALLMLYSVPLGFVLLSGSKLFDIGHAMAAVVGGSLVLSAITHAAMNWGCLPFTGRNLPLLSVNSLSDPVLWILLLGLGVQSMFWSCSGLVGERMDSDCLSKSNAGENAATGHRFRRWLKLFPIALPAIVFFAWSGWVGYKVLADPALSKGFDWHGLLDEVNEKIERGELRMMQDGTIEPQMSLNTLLGQEIAKFNALTEDERIEGGKRNGLKDFKDKLAQVNTLPEYDRVFKDLRFETSEKNTRRRPVLFEAIEPDEWADLDEMIPAVNPQYHLRANRAYNARVNFRPNARPEDFPTIRFRDNVAGEYSISGPKYQFFISDKAADPLSDRDVLLEQHDSAADAIDRGDPATGKARVFVKVVETSEQVTVLQERRRHGRKSKSKPRPRAMESLAGDFEVRADGLNFRPGRVKLQMRRSGMTQPISSGIWRRLQPGDVIESVDLLTNGFRLQMSVGHSSRGAIIGPAWVNGNWVLAFNSEHSLPWASWLSEAVWSSSEHRSRKDNPPVRALSLDEGLQNASQDFLATKGRQLHEELIRSINGKEEKWRQVMPPRIALTILDATNGEVLTLAGWPVMTSGDAPQIKSTEELIPDSRWLEDQAPNAFRQRYAGDRNFDRLLMGSSTKPIWASAILVDHKDVDRLLKVTGPGQEEAEVFGIPVNPGWKLTHAPVDLENHPWCDFKAYLAKSDNRYHVRLGFLGLAEVSPEGSVITGPASPSTYESMDGGRTQWKHEPKFLDFIEFSGANPRSISKLQATPLATHLKDMYGVGVSAGDIRPRRYSFWTGNEFDDVFNTLKDDTDSDDQFFAPISPESPQLQFDTIDHPRRYINLLLGGGENRWANADFAAAFTTAVEGKPITAHIWKDLKVSSSRMTFPEVAKKLHPGLTGVLQKGGTAYERFVATGGMGFLNSLGPDVYYYAKTGTLPQSRGLHSTSRLVVVIVRRNPGTGAIRSGVALSLVIERAEEGRASLWLGEYLAKNGSLLRKYLPR